MKENSIEEDIMKLERFSNENVLYGSVVAMTLERYKDLQLSIEHILDDYKRVLKENEELKIKEFQLHLDTEEMKSMIYKQKVKEKIEELEKRKQEYKEENTIDEDYFFDINGYNSAIFVLQELLEGRKIDV